MDYPFLCSTAKDYTALALKFLFVHIRLRAKSLEQRA